MKQIIRFILAEACLITSASAQPRQIGTPEQEAAYQAHQAKQAEEAKAKERAKQEFLDMHPLYSKDITDVALQRLEKRLADAAEKGDKEGTAEGLKLLENYWTQAVVRHDTAAIERIEADDFICTDPSGAVTHKADDLDVAKSGALEVTETKLEDIAVNLLGDTAVLTGKSTFTGRAPVVELAVSGSYRWTDVFARRDGRWQVVASQATNIEPPSFGKSAGN